MGSEDRCAVSGDEEPWTLATEVRVHVESLEVHTVAVHMQLDKENSFLLHIVLFTVHIPFLILKVRQLGLTCYWRVVHTIPDSQGKAARAYVLLAGGH